MKNEAGPFFIAAPAILLWPIILILIILHQYDRLKSATLPLLILTAAAGIGALFLGFFGYCWIGILTAIALLIAWALNQSDSYHYETERK